MAGYSLKNFTEELPYRFPFTVCTKRHLANDWHLHLNITLITDMKSADDITFHALPCVGPVTPTSPVCIRWCCFSCDCLRNFLLHPRNWQTTSA